MKAFKNECILQHCKQHVAKRIDFFVCENRSSEAWFYRSSWCTILSSTQSYTNCLKLLTNTLS